MTNAVLSQQALEVASQGTPSAVLSQQTLEVANTVSPAAVVSQLIVEAVQGFAPPANVDQVVLEVLTSIAEITFDPNVAFWGFEPDGEVTERYSWLSDIEVAKNGDQVRVSLRNEPRVQVEFGLTTTTAKLGVLADAILTGWQASSYYLPIWQDRSATTVGLAAGDTAINVSVDGLGYIEGGFVALWSDPSTYEIAQISTISLPSTLLLSGPLLRAWPAGVSIAPARRAWLQAEASAQRFTGEVMEARLVFDIEAPVTTPRVEWNADSGGAWTADGFALFAHRPNWIDAPQITYSRRIRTFGDGTTKPWRDDPSGRGWIRRQELHTATTRAEANALISWAAHRRGRALSYLSPIWDASLQVTRSNTASATSLYVSGRSYEQLLGAISGRGYVALRDATGWIVRRVLAATTDGADNMLTLSSAIGRAGTPSGWLDVVWCEPSHLSSDTVEIRWWDNQTADMAFMHEQVIG